jgi:hypothetical protein
LALASSEALPRGSSFHTRKSWSSLDCTTMDVTPIFNEVLRRHDGRPVEPYVFRVEDLEEFVKEAYRIVGHVARNMLNDHRTDWGSEHIYRSYTPTSNRYGRAIFLMQTRLAENNLHAQVVLQRRQKKTPNTSPTPSAPKSMHRQSSHYES